MEEKDVSGLEKIVDLQNKVSLLLNKITYQLNEEIVNFSNLQNKINESKTEIDDLFDVQKEINSLEELIEIQNQLKNQFDEFSTRLNEQLIDINSEFTFLKKSSKVEDVINIDLNSLENLDRTGKNDVSNIIQEFVNRSIRDYPTTGDYDKSKTITVEIKMPPGKFLINNMITVDCHFADNPASSDQITFAMKGAGGKSGTSFYAGPNLQQMFDFKYGRLCLRDLRFYGDKVLRKTLFAETGRTARDFSLGNPSGDVVVPQSVFSNCEWYYFNRVFKASHMIDTAFYDCGMFAFIGTNPLAFEIPLREADNCNNIMFYRCHWEQMNGGTFFKATGGAPSSSLTHSVISFFGCHFETRYWNTTILDLSNVYNVSFYNTQFTHNNNQGAEFAGLKEENIVPMFKLHNIVGLNFDNCLISRIGVTTPANIANKMFDISGRIKGMRISGGFMDQGNNSVNLSTDSLVQQNTVTPYRDTGDSWCTFNDVVLFDPSVPPINSDRISLVSSQWRHQKWGIKHNASSDLEIGYTNTTSGHFNWTTPALQITEQGALRSASFSGPKKSISVNSTVKFAVANKYNLNRRGIYCVYADHNLATYVMFFSDGGNVFHIAGSSNVSLGKEELSDAGKLNVYLDSNKDIAVKNLFTYAVNVVVTHLGT